MRASHTREVVQDLAGQRQVGLERCGGGTCDDARRLGILRQSKPGEDGVRNLLANYLAGVVVERGVDTAVDAA